MYVIKYIIVNDCFVICVGLSLLSKTVDVTVENLYAHKTKTLDTTPVKRKHGRPPKPKPQIPISKTRTMTAAKTLTT